MDKDNGTSGLDFDKDPEFCEKFYKNIEKALGDTEEIEGGPVEDYLPEDIIDHKVEEPVIEFEDVSVTAFAGNRYVSRPEASKEESAAAVQTVKNLEEDNMEDEGVDDELTGINASLAKQICVELDTIGAEKAAERKKWLFRIQSGVALALLCLVGMGFFLGCTKPGNKLLIGMGINLSGTIWAAQTGSFDDGTDVTEDTDFLDQEDLNANGEEYDTSKIIWPNNNGVGKHEDGVYNILLLGEEAIGSDPSRGRTDVIVIATLNTIQKSVKLTSLMRDMLVQIPGYKENKLNSAFEKGGLDLLYDTIAMNLDIRLDGAVMVNFQKFEEIIDELGGLELTLTAGEARYLNSTNYISNPANRHVKEGTQLLNGNQVLGYARVRKRSTITGNNNDYGRTDRHRIILNAIFEKYKTKNKAELAVLMLKILPMITTDIDSKNFELLLNAYVNSGASTIEQLRIPADGTFQGDAKVRGMSVLIPDYVKNADILHKFIFGDDSVQMADDTATGSITSNGSTAVDGTTAGVATDHTGN